ncbi:unnamed protein product [Spirodela intermedia]|uniref:DUF7054 domain-containing protein n=1 Tax=Spirodela intermedia TaxID=51605 RepID=A0A7I8ISG7_SPIIN|nr:unnamed protein product [Spirodela intermedia]CAA6660736.1 unnamed protein product [Spirodela intermedia]
MPTKDSGRTRGGGGGARKLAPEKSASFHGRVPTEHRTLRRPKTQPDLIGGSRVSAAGTPPWDAAAAPPPDVPPAKRIPAKSGAVQVVASTDWTVGELVAGLLQQYAKEGRRPLLPSSEPSDFALHYSQFSLEGLDPREKLITLGSRNFFLCPKPRADPSPLPATPPAAAAETPSASSSPAVAAEKTCSTEAAAEKTSKGVVSPWLRLMDFLL